MNLFIVQKAIESAESMDTVLIRDDTELLVTPPAFTHQKFSFASDRRKNTKGQVWNNKEVQAKLGTFECKHIPFLHAFVGCDTTPCLFGIGKGSILKKIHGK